MAVSDPLPQDRLILGDGGLETTLILHERLELPGFAAFVLLEPEVGGCCGTDARQVGAVAGAWSG
jgi:hypothetical protein